LRRPGLAGQVLIGFTLGIAVGIFFGELVGFLDFAGQAFVRLLQMTVLPYVVVSLVGGLGRLGARDAARLGLWVGAFLLVIWSAGLVIVGLMPLAFPDWESSSFFSTSLVAQREPFDFLELYFTSNPFHAMANTVVPATVLFSLALGVGLIGVRDKERIIQALSVIGEALSRVAGFVARLAPIGVFAIAASTAGTMEIGQFQRLQVYVGLHAGMALAFALVILPGLVSLWTPINPGLIVRRLWGAMITAFATGSVFVVLHVISGSVKRLLEEARLDREKADTSVDVIVPTTYNFPSLGALLSLFFLLFAGWSIGSALSVTQYPTFLITGLFSLFGSATLAVPFLLDFLQLPADLFKLYIAVDVISSRFAMLLSTVNISALALLGACGMAGRLEFRPKRLAPFLGFSAAAVALVLVGNYLVFTHVVSREYRGYTTFVSMGMLTEPVPAKLHTEAAALAPDTRPALTQIEERGSLRVCYPPDALPFAFVNADAQLVGFDVAMAHKLARELGVTLEFLRVERRRGAEALEAGRCELFIAGTAVTPENSRRVAMTVPYVDETLAFIVPNERRDEFNTEKALQAHESLRLGIPDVPYYLTWLKQYLPQAELVVLDSPRAYLRGDVEGLDGFAFAAESGSAWTLIYPQFTVALPKPVILAVPVAYAVRKGDPEWLGYLDVWIQLKKNDQTIQRLYDHWILGQYAQSGKRWSVIRDVLGWVD
jgi:Na+/H+-dicarboxylate symporter/ABC-type amino acid transport substrate-binding protein